MLDICLILFLTALPPLASPWRGELSERNVDRRCNDAIRNLQGGSLDPFVVAVNIPQGGTVEGRVIYLCDGPGLPVSLRPVAPFETSSYFYRPQGIYGNLTVFYGIPYAKPPLGPLRFRDPQFPTSWKLSNAQDYRPACPQHFKYYGSDRGVRDISEDCLYLNVFTPYAKPVARTRFAVMVYIHGGLWERGSANVFPPHMLVVSQQVVVVTLNYRLGPLGFLATGDNSSAGNYGLLDQKMAIQWVYDNIDAFNGDRDRITLFGPGAGAASAGLHVLSPYSGRLVRRVIAQSGAAVADWAVVVSPSLVNSSAHHLARQVGCDTTRDSWRLVSCLREIPYPDLMGLTLKPEMGWTMWAPVVDRFTRPKEHQFIPAPPKMMLEDPSLVFHSDFAYMSGVTRDEATAYLREELRERHFEVTRETLDREIWAYINRYNYTLDRAALVNAISFMYVPPNDRHNRTLLRQAYTQLLSDSYVNAPHDLMVKLLLRKNVKTYMYLLNSTLEGLKPQHDWEGVPHDYEYFLITGAPFMDHGFYPLYLQLEQAEWTQADRNLSSLLMQLWANFAKTGDPTPEMLFDHILWQEATLERLQYLVINTTNHTTHMAENYRQKESHFWNSYLPSILALQDRGIFIQLWEPSTWRQEKDRYEVALISVASVAALFFILMVCCCCLYCRTKRKHLVEDEDIPDGTTPNASNAFLDMSKMNNRDTDDDDVINRTMTRPNRHTMV